MDKNEVEFARRFLHEEDKEAFKQLFLLYADKIFNLVKYYQGRDDEAEELVQEVFLKLWVNRNKIHHPEALSSFIYKTSRNIIYDSYRKNYQRKAYSEYLQTSFNLDSTLNTEETVYFNDLEKVYSDLIEELPEKRKQVFLLSRYNGYSNKQIAEELDISVRTVEEHIRQALKYLKDVLKTRYDITVCILVSLLFL